MRVGLIPAAGLASRLGITTPKELLLYQGQAIIDYSIDHLIAARVNQIVIVIRVGKEAIREHVEEKYAGFPFVFVYQSGAIGRLIDAIKASYDAIKGHEVYFCMADTQIKPNPFPNALNSELLLLCFQAVGDEWRHFGVVDTQGRRIVDKPSDYVDDMCWGALAWGPPFTERLMEANDFTAVMNQAAWDYALCITSYKDIGL
ncbi:MAG: NTP transferase domain-containing protein [Chloroflexi bacterium]|nr:NTP transferase domain-containing protein [Chloroflexota bacterium]